MHSKRQICLCGTIAIAALQLYQGPVAAQQLPARSMDQMLAQAEPSQKDKNDKQVPGKLPPGQPHSAPQKPALQQPTPPMAPQPPTAPKGAQGPSTPSQDHRAPSPAPTHAQQPPTTPAQPPKITQPAVQLPHGPASQNAQQQQAPSAPPTQPSHGAPAGTGAPHAPTTPPSTPQVQSPKTTPAGGAPAGTVPPHTPTAPQSVQQQSPLTAPQGQPPKGAQQLRSPASGTPASGMTTPQNTRSMAGQPNPAPAAVGAQRLDDLRTARHERLENNRKVIEEPGRMIIQENGRAFIRHDETERFRLFGGDVRVEKRGPETMTVLPRPDGTEIVTVIGPDGRLVRRFRRFRDGREIVLIDNRPRPGAVVDADPVIALPPLRLAIPRDDYVVDMERAPPQRIIMALEAPPLEPISRPYTMDEIRYSPLLRDRMRRIDLDTINFETGSWRVDEDQVARLDGVAGAINAIVGRNPNEMFLIEGHTDAVGSDVDNLSLSDRRAESIALVLTQSFQVPPENLVTQGYGAHELKVPTQEASRENRRVTIRRVTPLLAGPGR
jgi:outer membrane protein OmpA-like peptidoglycan-associated protein